MASKKIPSGSEEFEMFKAFWGLYQKYYMPEDRQEYWDALVNETTCFYETYVEFEMAKYMADSLVDCFEKKHKGKK